MGTESSAKAYPQVVKLDNALKLAEAWVKNMSGSTSGEENEVEFESRPPRLGLGAKVSRHTEVTASTDPVERKLIGKLGVGKRQSSSMISKESDAHKLNGLSDEDDDESESRTSVFDKKRTTLPAIPLQAKKKQKGA